MPQFDGSFVKSETHIAAATTRIDNRCTAAVPWTPPSTHFNEQTAEHVFNACVSHELTCARKVTDAGRHNVRQPLRDRRDATRNSQLP